MRFRVASWNLQFGRADDALLDGKKIDLIALQEVTPEAFERFSRHFSWSFNSLGPWLEDGEEVFQKHSPAIMGSDRFVASVRAPLDHLLAPSKLLVADLRFVGKAGFFSFGSYHAWNGQRGLDGCDKPRLTLQVADSLEHEPGSVILGFDANSPDVDHPDHDLMECYFTWAGPHGFERRLLGPEARHGCRDVLRTWLAEHPEALAEIVEARPRGPLAVSHRTGSHIDPDTGESGNARRYDHILASVPDFRVRDVSYIYEEACEAGSDHALVLADLEVDVDGHYEGTSDRMLATALLGPA